MYRWDWDSDVWAIMGSETDIVGVAQDQQVGAAVSLSADGSIVAVGIPGYNSLAGTVGTFKWNESSSQWILMGSLDDMAGVTPARPVGYSLSISNDGSTVVVGDYLHADLTGMVRVYRWNEALGMWGQVIGSSGPALSGTTPGMNRPPLN